MKRPYLGLWALLVIAFIAFTALSFNGDVAEQLGLKTGSFEQTLTAQNVKNKKQTAAKRKAAAVKENKRKTGVMDTTNKVILFIGDSMLEGLGPRFAAYAKENGHKLYYVIWYSSTSEVWGRTTKLKEFIKQFKPDYVFICLGSNELFVRNIQEQRQKYVDNIISQIGDLPYVWIGPPNWKDDTGINELILSHVGPSRYFESKRLSFDRCKDGAHPTKKSAFRWMDEIAAYLASDAQHTLVMNTPDTAYNKAPHTTILQMVRE